MDSKLNEAFEKIHAEDALIEKTAVFLSHKIQSHEKPRKTFRKRLVTACASFVLLFLIGGFSYMLYFTPSAYVDMDVNPSVELALNRFGRVINADPYNEDGVDILQDVNLYYKTYDEAAQILLDEMIKEGYLKQDSLISVTVQSGDGNAEQRLLDGLREAVSASLISHHSNAAMDIFAVSQEFRKIALDYEISPAKYLAITELQAVEPDTTVEGCAGHSISEIRQLTEAHGGKHHRQDTGLPSNNEGHHNEPTDNESTGKPDDNYEHHSQPTGTDYEPQENHHQQQRHQNSHHR